MSQDSLFWTTNGTGDGASGGYTHTELKQWLWQTFGGGNNQGPLTNYLNELEVTAAGGSASPVTIDTGAAYVRGIPYWNTSAGTKNISTPAVSTRIDRIVVKADWTAQTVRFDIHAGSEGGTAPPLTQTDEVIWEIPLAQVSITTGGEITVTDDREFLLPNLAVASHATEHIKGGDDPIVGNTLDISWIPSYYTRDANPPEVTHPRHLTAHLKGIDNELASVGSATVQIAIVEHDTALTVGDAQYYWTVPKRFNGFNIKTIDCAVQNASGTGKPKFQFYNTRKAADILTTEVTIDVGEYTSYTAGTAAIVDTSNDDLLTGDRIRCDCDSAGTGTKGWEAILVVAG